MFDELPRLTPASLELDAADIPTASEIRAYIDQYASSILVRVRIDGLWRDMSIAALRLRDAAEAARVVDRLAERGALPHRVLVL